MKSGIKGFHHKVLLHTAGGAKYKYSTTHGLRSKEHPTDTGSKDPKVITHTLFGKGADHTKIHSFKGVTSLIKRHIPASEHQGIYDRFKGIQKTKPDMDHSHAFKHLRDNLNVKDA